MSDVTIPVSAIFGLPKQAATPPAYRIRQVAGNTANSTTCTATFASALARGNYVVAFGGQAGANRTLSFSSPGVASFTTDVAAGSAQPTIKTAHGLVSTSGQTQVTLTSLVSNFMGLIVVEIEKSDGVVGQAIDGGTVYTGLFLNIQTGAGQKAWRFWFDFVYENGGGSGAPSTTAMSLDDRVSVFSASSNFLSLAYGILPPGNYVNGWNANGGSSPRRAQIVMS